MSRGELEALGIVRENSIVLDNGLIVVVLRICDFAEVELSVGSEVGVAVILEVILKFLASEIVLAAGNVAETVRVERIRRRRTTRGNDGAGHRGAACWGSRVVAGGWGPGRRRRCAGDFCVKALHGVLEIDELLVELAEARLDFLKVVGESLNL